MRTLEDVLPKKIHYLRTLEDFGGLGPKRRTFEDVRRCGSPVKAQITKFVREVNWSHLKR